ncbi:MAG: hypothetical protein ACOY3M_00390 [Patescibacteria group bacterium]
MDSIQPEQTKPNTSLLKVFLAVIFFPFTISYLIWKQTQFPTLVRVLGILIFWGVFIKIGSSGSSTSSTTTGNNNTEVVATKAPTPTVVVITLEQKQTDFKELYKKYQSGAQGMLLVQVAIQKIASTATSKADLYLALDKVEKTQSAIASANSDINTPNSLKEYKQISEALMNFQIAGNNFTDAIKKMKEYVNKDDLEKLTQGKEQIDRGTARLSASKDLMDAVAKTLEVDVTQIQGTK